MDENNNKKNIKIVNGDGSNLDISQVYDHLNSNKPNCNNKKPKNIIIPKDSNSKKNK